ncbi:hypothetical protein AVEN_150227-1 [Araneus ventricosus]|uniref:Uncharacterized protein n=1 Tax=Araneus ventricosus TaxID=182803 RepID=A0A4Y2G7B6_ARAVE|nr:hypothetical protein AVEN_150227-1 [Araneus ventricosus]
MSSRGGARYSKLSVIQKLGNHAASLARSSKLIKTFCNFVNAVVDYWRLLHTRNLVGKSFGLRSGEYGDQFFIPVIFKRLVQCNDTRLENYSSRKFLFLRLDLSSETASLCTIQVVLGKSSKSLIVIPKVMQSPPNGAI